MTRKLAHKSGTLIAYERKLAHVRAYISAHIDDDLATPLLAAQASMSLFHFHRIYLAMFEETPADTVRRLRLERAARQLIGSGLSLREVGKRAGYSSEPAFSRAFRRFAGVTPGAYRARAVDHAPASPIKAIDTLVRREPKLTLSLLPYEGDLPALLAALPDATKRLGARGDERIVLVSGGCGDPKSENLKMAIASTEPSASADMDIAGGSGLVVRLAADAPGVQAIIRTMIHEDADLEPDQSSGSFRLTFMIFLHRSSASDVIEIFVPMGGCAATWRNVRS